MIEVTAESLIPLNLLPRFTRQQINGFVQDMADAARAEWVKLGSQIDSSMRNDYVRAIQPGPKVQGGVARVVLVGSVANMLEHGAPQQDMRDFLLGPEVPVVPRGMRGKHEAEEGGYYRAIPFRHATPGASAGAVGQEMGSAYEGHEGVENAKKLGREVYGEARQLGATKSAPGRGTAYGERLPEGMAPKLRDYHATDIYAGMVREEKTYEQATQSQYVTFRTISTHRTNEAGERVRATEKWIRGPIRARKLAEQVAIFVERIAPRAIEAILGGGR
jgi:hypothetical protein